MHIQCLHHHSEVYICARGEFGEKLKRIRKDKNEELFYFLPVRLLGSIWNSNKVGSSTLFWKSKLLKIKYFYSIKMCVVFDICKRL